jgi:hypothetical protein
MIDLLGFVATLSTTNPKLGFHDFWAAYPRRKGSNPRAPAEIKFCAIVKSGADPEHLISSAKRYGDELREQNLLGTEFVCQAKTWLNQKRWLDYQPDPASKERDAKIDADMANRGYKWSGSQWLKIIATSGK